MFRIALVNMPFASVTTPSIALSQLKSVTESRLAGEVSVDISYVTHDFAKHIGIGPYLYVSHTMQALYAGLGDWLFRGLAFPELPDNADAYLRRFFWAKTPEAAQVKELAKTRATVGAFLDEVITRYRLDQADIVGFTSMFMQNVACFALARRLKQRNPRVITVMGGANCEFPMGRVIAERIPDIDFVFSGPALKSFPQFVRCCLDGDPGSARAIGGVFAKPVQPALPPPFPLGEELDIDTPLELDYDDFFDGFEKHFPQAPFKPIVPIETSRGCWWGQRAHCTFCGLNGATMAYRAMSPPLALEQFAAVFRYRGRAPMVQAVDNILPKSYLTDVMPFLDTPPDMEIFYEVKADLSRRELAVLARARVRRLQPGIESLATSTLKLMQKGTSSFQNIQFLKNCAALGIEPVWNLLVGFPGEGADVYQRYLEVLPLLSHLTPPSGVFPVRFDRFSPYHKRATDYALDLRPMDFYSAVYPFAAADLQDFAYYFSDANLKADYFKAMTDWIQKLRAAVAQWHARAAAGARGNASHLRFAEASDVVHDSRSGSPREYAVGELGKAMLQRLAVPARIDEVTRSFPVHPEAEVASTLAMLVQRGLLFVEDGRALSLVVDSAEDLQAELTSGPDRFVMERSSQGPGAAAAP